MWLAFAYINEYQKKKIEYKDMICERKNKVLSEVSLCSFSSFFFPHLIFRSARRRIVCQSLPGWNDDRDAVSLRNLGGGYSYKVNV